MPAPLPAPLFDRPPMASRRKFTSGALAVLASSSSPRTAVSSWPGAAACWPGCSRSPTKITLQPPDPSTEFEPSRSELATIAQNEIEFEAQLIEYVMMSASGPSVGPQQRQKIESVVQQLEEYRGRQQRAGWGQSDSAWDLPFIGAWDVIYPRGEASEELGGELGLVSRRQWIYGPGPGGLAAECIYRSLTGPAGGSLLLTRMGGVTKLDGALVRLEFASTSSWYSLGYSARPSLISGKPPTVDSEPSVVGRLPTEELPADTRRRLCIGEKGSEGSRRTTYLSDELWVTRDEGDGAITVLKRTSAEAMQPQNGEGPDGFDARRFGPSGRKMYMFDSGSSDSMANLERARARMRSSVEISGS